MSMYGPTPSGNISSAATVGFIFLILGGMCDDSTVRSKFQLLVYYTKEEETMVVIKIIIYYYKI